MRSQIDVLLATAAAAGLVALGIPGSSGRLQLLLLLGMALGGVLYTTSFSLVSSYREFVMRSRAVARLAPWVWIVAALAGTAVGVRLRPWFELKNSPRD